MSKAAQSLVVTGRVGHASFINGQYELKEEVLNGKPVYQSTHSIPDGYGDASNEHIYLYYHQDNDAWVLSHTLQSLDVIGYAPTHIKNTWHINNGAGPFVPDPSLKLVTAANGQVLTNLGAWTSDLDGEVALKIQKEGPASGRPMTVLEMLKGTAERFPDVPALSTMRPDGGWTIRTYRQFYEDVHNIAKAFVAMGLEPSKGVALIGFGSAEWTTAHLAGILAGGVSAGLSGLASREEIEIICDNIEANIIIVENDDVLQKVMAVRDELPSVKAVIMIRGSPNVHADPDLLYSWSDLVGKGGDTSNDSNIGRELATRQQNLRANKCAVVAITMGATGAPKPAMLSHDNITWTARLLRDSLDIEPAQDQFVAYMPPNHMMAQMFELWLPIASAATIHYGRPQESLNVSGVTETLRAVRPTFFFGVPAFYERLQSILSDTNKVSDWAKKKGMKGSIRRQSGRAPSWKSKMAGSMSLNKIKKQIGMDRCRCIFSHSESLKRQTLEYFLGVGVPIYEIYGAAEGSGVSTISLPGAAKNGSVGKTLPGIELKLTHGAHEIIQFGRNVFMGYVNDAEATAQVVDDRGWYHSADMASAGRDLFVSYAGRLEELITTAGGEKIVPFALERRIKKELPFVSNCVLGGEKRKFLCALLTLKTELDSNERQTERLSQEAIAAFKKLNVQCYTVSDVTQDTSGRLQNHIQGVMERVTQGTGTSYRIEKFVILPRDFSVGGGEIDELLRLKRRSVLKRYARQIDQVYGGQAEDYESSEWYHGPITRKAVEALMKRDNGGWDGWFLIRKSTKEANTFVISLVYKTKLFHNQIKFRDGVYSTHEQQGNHQYDTLSQLIDHHKEGANGFQTKLGNPCKKYKT